MKLFYCLGNTKKVLEIITKQEKLRKKITTIIDFLDLGDNNSLKEFFNQYIRRNFKSSDLEEQNLIKIKEDFSNSTNAKKTVAREIRIREIKQLQEPFNTKSYLK